jgi:hypothetical protein
LLVRLCGPSSRVWAEVFLQSSQLLSQIEPLLHITQLPSNHVPFPCPRDVFRKPTKTQNAKRKAPAVKEEEAPAEDSVAQNKKLRLTIDDTVGLVWTSSSAQHPQATRGPGDGGGRPSIRAQRHQGVARTEQQESSRQLGDGGGAPRCEAGAEGERAWRAWRVELRRASEHGE